MHGRTLVLVRVCHKQNNRHVVLLNSMVVYNFGTQRPRSLTRRV